MMIMRFHKLIQSRLMWLIFLGVVVFSFVFMDYLGANSSTSVAAQLRQPVARISGEPLRFLEFDIARRQLEQNLPPQADRTQIDDLVFSRFARLEQARQLGILVPRAAAESDLRQTLAQDAANDPDFMNRFRLYLRNQGITEAQLVDFIQQELTLQELQRVLASFAMIAPFDAERWAAFQTDQFALAVLELSGTHLPEPEAPAPEILQAYFDENAADFEIPEQRSIRYLSLDLAAFERPEDTLTGEQARERYDANPSNYDRQTPVMTEEGGFELKREPRTFEQVKDEIIRNHRTAQARSRANDEAMGLSVRLTPRRGRPAPEMTDLAAEMNLDVTETTPFGRTDSLPGLPGASALVRAAFDLDLSPVGRTSQPIVSGGKVHVIQLTAIQPPRIPALDEVRDAVTAQWTAEQKQQQLLAFAQSTRETLQAALQEGKTIAQAAEGLEGVELTDPPPFQLKDLSAAMPSVPFSLLEELTAHTTGDLFGPVEDPRTGSVHLAYVLSREPRPEDAAEMVPELRDQLATQLQFQGFTAAYEETVIEPMIERIETAPAAAPDAESPAGEPLPE